MRWPPSVALTLEIVKAPPCACAYCGTPGDVCTYRPHCMASVGHEVTQTSATSMAMRGAGGAGAAWLCRRHGQPEG